MRLGRWILMLTAGGLVWRMLSKRSVETATPDTPDVNGAGDWQAEAFVDQAVMLHEAEFGSAMTEPSVDLFAEPEAAAHREMLEPVHEELPPADEAEDDEVLLSEPAPEVVLVEEPEVIAEAVTEPEPVVESELVEETPELSVEAESTVSALAVASEPEVVVDADVPAPIEPMQVVNEAPVEAIAAELPLPSGAPENLTIAAMLAGVSVTPPSEPMRTPEMDLAHAFSLVERDDLAARLPPAVNTTGSVTQSPFTLVETPQTASVVEPETPIMEVTVFPSVKPIQPLVSADFSMQLPEEVKEVLAAVPVSAMQKAPAITAPLIAAEPPAEVAAQLGKSAAWLLGLEPMSLTDGAMDKVAVVPGLAVKKEVLPIVPAVPQTSPLAVGAEIPDRIEIPEPVMHPTVDQLIPGDSSMRPITKGLLSKVLEKVDARPKTGPITSPLKSLETTEVSPPPVQPAPRILAPRTIPRPASWIAAELANKVEQPPANTAPKDAPATRKITPQAPAVAASSDKKAWIDWWK